MTNMGETWVAMWTRWLIDVFDLTDLEATAIAYEALVNLRSAEVSPSTLNDALDDMAAKANRLHEAGQP